MGNKKGLEGAVLRNARGQALLSNIDKKFENCLDTLRPFGWRRISSLRAFRPTLFLVFLVQGCRLHLCNGLSWALGGSKDVLGVPWSGLGLSWMPLGPFGRVLGASWAPLEASWEGLAGLLGRCWGLLERSSGLLGRS